MNKKEPIRILQIVPNMQAGGIENMLMNIYREVDKEKVQFDFLVHYSKKEHFDDEIIENGGKIYNFSLREDSNIFKYMHKLNKFYKEHKEYKVIHCHMSSIGFINFLIAKHNGIKIRIAHSHNTNTAKNFKGFIKRIFMWPYRFVSSVNFACSTEAGRFLFKKRSFTFIPNAIDVNRFKFNDEARIKIRKQLGFKDDDVILGHVGRFNVQKNHMFLLDVFKKICDENKNYKLLLIGDGELRQQIEKKIKQLGIENNVVMTGVVKNTNDYYNAMDIFVLPSLFEGLPVTGVEAQTNGLCCLFADNITKETKFSDSVRYIELNVDKWAEEILQANKIEDRQKNFFVAQKTNFNIKTLAQKMQEKYSELYMKGKTDNE